MNEEFDLPNGAKDFMRGQQDFLHVHNSHQLTESDLFDTAALILDAKDEQLIIKMLKKIRSMRYKSFYLKPVFLAEGKYSKQLVSQTDGVLYTDQIPNILDRVESINKRIEEIRTVTSKYTFSESILVKTLQYLFTRKTEMIPFRDRNSILSYCFPFISSIISREDQVILLDVLDYAHSEGLLEQTLVDRVNLCKTCYGTYHNFREVCPKCSSLNLQSVDLIHHFRCAFIGPATDYKQGGALVCPKCDKELRHIGIDYDKPSEIFNCLACNHQAQIPNMRAHCVDCGEENELEYLKTRAIYRFRLTAYGEEIAENGLQKIDKETISITDDQRVLPIETWQVLLRQEIERVKLHGIRSKVISVKIADLIIDPMDQDTRRDFKKEVLRELISYIRPVDVVTTNNTNEVFILFPDIKTKEVIEMEEVFDYNLNKMIRDNIPTEEEVVTIKIFPVEEDLIDFSS